MGLAHVLQSSMGASGSRASASSGVGPAGASTASLVAIRSGFRPPPGVLLGDSESDVDDGVHDGMDKGGSSHEKHGVEGGLEEGSSSSDEDRIVRRAAAPIAVRAVTGGGGKDSELERPRRGGTLRPGAATGAAAGTAGSSGGDIRQLSLRLPSQPFVREQEIGEHDVREQGNA